ncbi:MAG: hypothetical protein ACOCP8_04835 [archaeon]
MDNDLLIGLFIYEFDKKNKFVNMEKLDKHFPNTSKKKLKKIVKKLEDLGLINMEWEITETDEPVIKNIKTTGISRDFFKDLEKRFTDETIIQEYWEETNPEKTIEVKNIPDEEAEKKMLNYLKENGSSYPSDIAEECELPISQILRVTNNLSEKGKIEKSVE